MYLLCLSLTSQKALCYSYLDILKKTFLHCPKLTANCSCHALAKGCYHGIGSDLTAHINRESQRYSPEFFYKKFKMFSIFYRNMYLKIKKITKAS